MGSLGTWFTGTIDSGRLVVGLDDLEGLLQPKRFYDSVKVTPAPTLNCISDPSHGVGLLFFPQSEAHRN